MSTLHVENLKGLSSGGNANKIIVPSGQTLDASNGFTPPSGHVIQIKVGGSTGWSTLNTTSYVDVLTCSITPSATTSNVFVMVHINGVTCSGLSQFGTLELYRDTTQIRKISDILGYSVSHVHYNTDMSSNFYDEGVSTTSAVTYKLKMKYSSNSNGRIGWNNYGTTNNKTSSTITLMEIAG
tara:strand:+ start:243 stop:788 length:546 start_codon:yes stop_codon:yes gene_type:complete